MAERGRLYLWPRNRSFGDSKARPVVVISPDAATRHGRRWVVLPLSTVSDLASNPLAYRLAPTATNGLRQASFVMTWLPTTVHADQLQGPLGRLTSAELTAIAASVIQALDLQGLEPWQLDPEASGAAGGTAALRCHLGYQICSAAASVESANDSRRLRRQGATANRSNPTARVKQQPVLRD